MSKKFQKKIGLKRKEKDVAQIKNFLSREKVGILQTDHKIAICWV